MTYQSDLSRLAAPPGAPKRRYFKFLFAGENMGRVMDLRAFALSFVLTGSAIMESRAELFGVVEKSRVVVVDGDSVTLDGQEWRLRGYDTPEIDKAQCEGERRLEELVAAAREIRIDGGEERDRYKRPLGGLLVDGRNVREIMIAELWARPYNGGRRKGWCSRDSIDTLVPGDPPLRRKGT